MALSRQQFSWLLYDPANAAYALIVRTVIAPVFLGICARNILSESEVTSLWSLTASAAGICAGAVSVLCGTRADAGKKKVAFLGIFTAAGIIFSLAYLFIPRTPLMVLIVSFAGIMCYMAANSFYDSLLSEVALPQERDRISTTGYAWGYAGGLLSFLLCLPLLFMQDGKWMFSGTFIIAALWWGMGSMPLFLNVREKKCSSPAARRHLKETFKFILSQKNILLFLIAYFLYIDGVGTILLAATPLATGLQIPVSHIMLTILALQILGLPFTLLYGRLSSRFSAKKMVLTAIAIYGMIAIIVTVMSFCSDLKTRQMLFYTAAALIGTSQGGIQSLSRSLFSKIIPAERSAELFAVYNIFGKFTTVVGPLFITVATLCAGRAELGITLLLLPFSAGALLLTKVKVPEK